MKIEKYEKLFAFPGASKIMKNFKKHRDFSFFNTKPNCKKQIDGESAVQKVFRQKKERLLLKAISLFSMIPYRFEIPCRMKSIGWEILPTGFPLEA